MADPKDEGKVSLAPLNPEEALRGLLRVRPDEHAEQRERPEKRDDDEGPDE